MVALLRFNGRVFGWAKRGASQAFLTGAAFDDTGVHAKGSPPSADDPRIHELLQALTQDSSDWIAILTPAGQFRLNLGGFSAMLGSNAAELTDQTFFNGVDPPSRPFVTRALLDLHDQPGGATTVEYRRVRRDGTTIDVRTTFVNRVDDPAVRGVVATTCALHSQSALADRTAFLRRLEHVVGMRSRPYAVAVIDVTDFRKVTGALGRSASGRLVERIARRLQASVGPADLVGHVGTQEFAVLFDGEEDEGRARAAVERLDGRLRAPFRVGGREVVVQPSVGYVTNRRGYENADEVLTDAMAAAQRAAKGRPRMYHSTMRQEDRRHLTLAGGLSQAVARQELHACYQPIIKLATEEIVGVEALVRWQHPELGMVSPAEFVPIAETTDRVIHLDRWMIEHTTREAATWGNDIYLSVNVSGRHLEDPDLPETVRRALENSGLDPARLRLEVTETAVASDMQASIEALQRLRALGVTLVIDDFGTGYASFGQLADFPFDVLKIERSMVRRVNVDGGRNVLPSMIAMAHQLGLAVVAEGIETVDECEALRQMGSEYGQGWLFSKAVPAAELRTLLSSWPA